MPQQFVVPQFIDVEDKIFGPITTRQFIIMLVSGLIIFAGYRWGDFTTFILVLAFIGGGSLVLAFVKVNGQTFHYFILNIIQTSRKPSLRVWHKWKTADELNFYRNEGMDNEVVEVEEAKKASGRRMRDLSLIVNTGGYYKPE